MSSSAKIDLPTKTTIVWRGVCERCPKCGQGKIFKSYLRQVEACSVCGADFSTIRADDGPAWLTILLTAHLVVPIGIACAMHDVLPPGIGISLMLLMTTFVALLILPRSKGAFISVLWMLAQKPAQKD